MVAQNSVIHGFIPAACANQYRVSQRTGAIVKVVRFDVGRCTNMYKIKDHPFVICLIPTTTTILTAAPFIDFQKFMLRKFHHLQALANTNFELPGNGSYFASQVYKKQSLHLYKRVRNFNFIYL